MSEIDTNSFSEAILELIRLLLIDIPLQLFDLENGLGVLLLTPLRLLGSPAIREVIFLLILMIPVLLIFRSAVTDWKAVGGNRL
jgi:hypothetical protein